MRTTLHTGEHGITSLEVAIGVSIAGIVIAFAANAIMLFLNSARDVTVQTQALYLAEDGLELLRYVRDEDWNSVSSLAVNTTYYLDVTPTVVSATGVPEVIDEFTRSFQVQNVYRDSSTDDIVASTTGGSVADTSTKYVTVTVSWGSPTESLSLSTILTNLNP
jgi:type II secretory pathway pseudopilin PulG